MRKILYFFFLFFSQTSYAVSLTTPQGFSGSQGVEFYKDTNGKIYQSYLCMTLDDTGHPMPCPNGGEVTGELDQGDANDGSTPWYVTDPAFQTSFDGWKGWANTSLSTRASEVTLSAFRSANHSDLVIVQNLIGQSNSKLQEIIDPVFAIDTKFDTELSTRASEETLLTRASETTLSDFKTANHSDLSSIITNTTGLATQATSALVLAKLDVALSTRASESTLSSFSSTTHADLGAISSALSPLSTATNQTTLNARVGDLTETAPIGDTASSGLNGRLQRIAQRISSLISTVSTETTLAALNAKFNSLGQKTMANSSPVVLASDQGAILVTSSNGIFSRIKNRNFADTEEVRYDVPTSVISGAIYTGLATAGTATSAATWTIVRSLFDANGNPSREQIKTSVIWDNRAALSW